MIFEVEDFVTLEQKIKCGSLVQWTDKLPPKNCNYICLVTSAGLVNLEDPEEVWDNLNSVGLVIRAIEKKELELLPPGFKISLTQE